MYLVMKQLNRAIYLLIIGIAVVLFFTYIFVMYQRGHMDTESFGGCCAYVALMAALGLFAAFSKNTWPRQKVDGAFDPLSVAVPHDRMGITVEVLTGLIIVGAWVAALASDRFWIIEGFFSFINPLLMFMLSIISITFLWIVYLPAFEKRTRKYTSAEQVRLEVSMCRCVAIEFALLVLTFALPLEDSSIVILYIIGAALVITIATYRLLIYNARSSSEDNEQCATVGDFNIDEVKLPRTAMSTLVEVIIGLLVVTAWALTWKNGLFTEDDGSLRLDVLFSMLIFTCLIIKMIWNTHRPGNIRDMGRLTNLKQVKLAVGTYRLIAALCAVGMLISSFPALRQQVWIFILLIAILAVAIITYRILTSRARSA